MATTKRAKRAKPAKGRARKAVAAKGRGGRTRAAAAAATDAFPDRLYGIASPRSVGGVSLFTPGVMADSTTVANFASDPGTVERAAYMLQDAGFEVLQVNNVMINIAGSRETYERAFNTRLVALEQPTIKEDGREEEATFFDSPDTPTRGLISTDGTRFQDVLEGVALEEPRYLMAAAALPPPARYWHLDVPADVSLGCNADVAHRDGITGRGIRVAMVDTGWFRHPFFTARGYRAQPVVLGPGTANPLADEVGHGTGESANIFAVAPDAELLPVKTTLSGSLGTVLVNATAAFNAAVALNPHIITNSWGLNLKFGPLSAAQQALGAAVAAAVAGGIVVVFSAGNGQWGFPGQHPDVISAGGVYMERDGSLRASDYASGFDSNIFAGRRVPDLSGLVGLQPGAKYIMLPVEPGDSIDTTGAGGTHPNGDETTNNDGWAAFSGTSAAAPQIAGAAALVLQACPRLTPAEVRDVLMRTARDVTTGTNILGNVSVVGPDNSTGNGLVDAGRAVLIAKLRCVRPIGPLVPLIPIRPLLPLRPLQPLLPLTPVQPIRPLVPLLPLQPLVPIQPLLPLQPVHPIQPLLPLTPIQPVHPLVPLTPVQPLQPIQPLLPLLPLQPLVPIRPLIPLRPLAPLDPGPFEPGGGGHAHGAEGHGGAQLSAEDVQRLEDIILSGGKDVL